MLIVSFAIDGTESLRLLWPWLLLFAASVLAGALNGVAGGGSFISFPALIFVGLPPIAANATNNTGTWVGYLASLYAYRGDVALRSRQSLTLMMISLLGGGIGAVLLLKTPPSIFEQLVPYLLLVATILFALNPSLKRWSMRRSNHPQPSQAKRISLRLLQGAIAIYGGFFGGGVGILLLALFGLMGMENIHAMNALKALLSACINGIALVMFMVSGAVLWPQALLLSVGTWLGGYWGVYYVRKADPDWVRRFVIWVGVGMSLYFWLKP